MIDQLWSIDRSMIIKTKLAQQMIIWYKNKTKTIHMIIMMPRWPNENTLIHIHTHGHQLSIQNGQNKNETLLFCQIIRSHHHNCNYIQNYDKMNQMKEKNKNQWINDETALFLVNRLREWWNSCDYNCRITISRGKWIFWSEKKNEFESGSINNVELMQNLQEIKVQMSHWTKNFFLFVCLIHKIKRREKKSQWLSIWIENYYFFSGSFQTICGYMKSEMKSENNLNISEMVRYDGTMSISMCVCVCVNCGMTPGVYRWWCC